MGIKEYPDSKDIQHFLSTSDQKPSRKHQYFQPGDKTAQRDKMSSLQGDINECTLCQLAGNSIGRSPVLGKTGALLMVIGDFSAQTGTYSPQTLFGSEEDVMLWNMMAAIELQPEHVYVTNCLKCCPADPDIINTTCEERCFSYLVREITAVRPKLICAMGDMASRVILGKKEPLTRIRGRFGTYRYQSGPEVAVMPTFHPRFLLQHQEMKRATWNDLKAVKRRLDRTS